MIKIAKRQSKIKTYDKHYPIISSPFYRLTSTHILYQLLSITSSELTEILTNKNYNCFLNKKGRLIQEPLLLLNKVHNRIASLLCRIKAPKYLHSGTKGKSIITNAIEHVDAKKLLKVDITKFFPSTTWDMVFNFFNHKLQCSKQVSTILTELCTLEKHIPTGSRLSMPRTAN